MKRLLISLFVCGWITFGHTQKLEITEALSLPQDLMSMVNSLEVACMEFIEFEGHKKARRKLRNLAHDISDYRKKRYDFIALLKEKNFGIANWRRNWKAHKLKRRLKLVLEDIDYLELFFKMDLGIASGRNTKAILENQLTDGRMLKTELDKFLNGETYSIKEMENSSANIDKKLQEVEAAIFELNKVLMERFGNT